MLLVVLLTGVIASATLFYWITIARSRRHFTSWKRRGVAGPSPHPIFGNIPELRARRQSILLTLKEWTKEYGPTYGYYEGSRRVLVTSDPDLVQEIFVDKMSHFDKPKPMLYKPECLRDLDGLCEMLSSLFADSTAHVKMLERVFRTPTMAPLKRSEVSQEYVADVAAHLCLGQRAPRAFHNCWSRPLIVDLEKSELDRVLVRLSLAFPLLDPIFMWMEDCITGMFYTSLPFVRSEIERTVDAKQKRKVSVAKSDAVGDDDLIDLLLNNGSDLDRDEIVAYCMMLFRTFIPATSSLLSLATWEGTRNERCRTKATELAVKILTEKYDGDPQQEITPAKIEAEYAAEPFAQWSNKELHRLYPVNAHLISRCCTRRCAVGKEKIQMEVGDCVQVDVLSLHTDPNVWGEDAEEFRPERWENPPLLHPAAYIPNGLGTFVADPLWRLGDFVLKFGLAHIARELDATEVDQDKVAFSPGDILIPRLGAIHAFKRSFPANGEASTKKRSSVSGSFDFI